MAKKNLGNKYACYQCGCKFYDLGRPQPICPKCGANQTEAPKKEPLTTTKGVPVTAVPSRARVRRKRAEEEQLDTGDAFADDDGESVEPLEDGLSMIDDEELVGNGPEDYTEED